MPPEAGGERTEPATPKRRQEARRKGQLARTAELGPALVLLAAYAMLSGSGPAITERATKMVQAGITAMADPAQLNFGTLRDLLTPQLLMAGQILFPLMAVLAGVAVASQLAQVGFLLTTEALKPKWSRLNPFEGIKRMFSKQALMELIRSLLKTAVIIYMGWGVVREAMQVTPELMNAPPLQAASVAGRLTGKLALSVGIVFFSVAALDYLYQRWEFLQSIRMSRKEIEDELKQSEGDPQIRSRIRQRQRKIAMSRMMAAIPQADVVVTNPVHVAVALRYDAKKMAAPVVVAKGAGLLAQRIKDIARQYRVPIVENVQLARGLYAGAEIGGIIPPEFYQAVAEVLAFVYRLRRKR